MTVTLTLSAQIPSGKNQVQLTVRGGRIQKYPNARFVAWRTAALRELRQQLRLLPVTTRMALPLTGAVTLTVFYHPLDKRTRDVSGLLDALLYILVAAEVLEDDGQIKGVSWPYPWRTAGPCVELEVGT